MDHTTDPARSVRPSTAAQGGPAPPRHGSRSTHARITLTMTAILSLATACGDSSTGPTQTNQQNPDLTCPSAGVGLCTNATAAATARDGTSDANTRLAGALENATARAAIQAELGRLDGALAAQNITNARSAVTKAREAIVAARAQSAQFAGDAADLDAIDLMLDYVSSLIN